MSPMGPRDLSVLIDRLRSAVRRDDTHEFEALRGTHHVFGVDGLVIKLFRSHRRHEPEREWHTMAGRAGGTKLGLSAGEGRGTL